MYLLHSQEIERLDVTNYLSHGISRIDESPDDAAFLTMLMAMLKISPEKILWICMQSTLMKWP